MAITTVDSFVRIFKFYQANPLVEKKRDPATGKPRVYTLADKFKENNLLYEDTIDVYLHSLVLDKFSQLSFGRDGDTIQMAMNAREKLTNYFSTVLYPGSYAYSTLDNVAIRKLILDWSSTIKTIQDCNRRVTDAYSLGSEDVDKAIRGFGIDFVNQNSLKSIDRRKLFLLNICDLYSIKGTPGSIVKALNIIGLEDIFLREAWLCKDIDKVDNDYDLQMRWEAQKAGQEFDSVNKTYVDLNTREDMYTSWDWFKEKIHDEKSTFDPHWFYTKDEIKNLNNSKDILLKLPSITPYFGIEYVSDLDRNIDSMIVLFNELNTQFQKYLITNSNEIKKKIYVSDYQNRISALECYTALIYSLIRLDEKIQYENFKSFLESNKFQVPDFEGPYEFMDLIYWMYQNRDNIFATSYLKLLHDYIPIKSNSYCSYENVLRWWLEKEVTDVDRNGWISDDPSDQRKIDKLQPNYIAPKKYIPEDPKEIVESQEYIALEWETPYPFGRYSVEAFGDGEWTEISNNQIIYDTKMISIVRTDYADNGSDNVGNFRIVIYHHSNNIPDVFFYPPFNFNSQPTNTLFDRVMRYNGVTTNISFYDDEQIKNAFINQQIDKKSSDYNVVSGYHESEALNSKIRVTQIQDTLMGYYGHIYNYPSNSKLYEDKWMNINTSFYDYVTWAIKDYEDTQSHSGCLTSNILENRKWPLNKRWNWAVDSKYYYINYESNKWMRTEYNSVTEQSPLPDSYAKSINYGDRFFIDGSLYVYVANNKWIVINRDDNYIETDWEPRGCDLLPSGKVKIGTQFCRDIAIGKIVNDDILQLIYNDTIYTDKSSEEYKFNIKELNQSIIEVQNEPFGNQLIPTSSYSYSSFLTYLYNARLTLDFDSGYIFPIFEGYWDKEYKVYLKCRNINGGVKWIRFNNTLDNVKWESCDAESLYGDNTTLGRLLPCYSLPDRYDSLRLLDGKIYNYRKELIEDFDNGNIDEKTNLVIVRPYVETEGPYKEDDDKYKNTYPIVYKKLPTISTEGTLKIGYKWVPTEVNRIHECMLGINPDLIEWIESYYAMDKQYYVEMPNEFAESLNQYIINELGVDGNLLDLIISSWANSGIVKKIINYYKPKRVRLLFVSNVLEGDYALSNGLDQIGITDNDFNYYDLTSYRWGDPRFNKKNFNRMNRQRISHTIDDYMPVMDTIYKDGDESNKVYNIRELRSQESKIPQIEVWDELVDMTRQILSTRNGNAYAVFYANNFVSYDDPTMNGFYYKVPLANEEIYSNNSYYFEKTEFIVKLNTGKLKSTIRWAMFRADSNDYSRDLAYYVADEESDVPYIHNDGTPMKYANCSSHDRLINNYIFSEGTFTTERFVKVGLRTISPVYYFRCFKNESCNGFYYHDAKIHPDRNERPVYYNLKGKIITFLDTTKYYKRTDSTNNFECSKFWLISDNKQVLDFNDCDYYAYTTNLNEEIDFDIKDVYNPDYTKQFYSFSCLENDDASKDKPSALHGITVSYLEDGNMNLIRDLDSNITAQYDNYTRFRRNHYNQVELTSKPSAYFCCNNKDINDYYQNISIESEGIDFTVDEHGGTNCAIKTNSDSTFIIHNPSNNYRSWTIAFKIKFMSQNAIRLILGSNASDILTNTWYMIVLTSDNNFYINKVLRNDLSHNGIFKTIVRFTNKEICLSEYGIWDYVLNEWYIGVITDFRIMRNRPEPSKSKKGIGPNNYRPLFAYNEPRTVYDRWSTGLPENIVGGRLNEYWSDSSKQYREISPFWPDRLPYDSEKNLIVKGAAKTMPNRRFLINDGSEVESSSNYRAGDVVQGWWPRYKDDYKTGPIHHRPVYVSVQHKIYDPYPLNHQGNQRKENYFDTGLNFDGVGNIDNSKFDGNNIIQTCNCDSMYDYQMFDENTNLGDTRIKKIENKGSTFKSEGSIDNIYVLDLDQFDMTSDDFNNCIFHKTLYLYNSPISQFNGEWTSQSSDREVKSWKDGDFYKCYKKSNNCEAVLTYQRDIGYIWWEIRLLENGNWKTKLRSYVNAKHNQNPRFENYDLLNYHQIDLAQQKLCIYNENDFETFKNHNWQEISQPVIESKFGCCSWIYFDITEEPNSLVHPGIDRYCDDRFYHIVFNDTWYKVSCELYNSDWDQFLPSVSTPSGYLYRNNYLYIWVENSWIRIHADQVTDNNKKIAYQLWKFRKDGNTVIVNVNDSSNSTRIEESFLIPGMIDITETMWKLIKFNGQPKYKWWNHMGEDVNYLKSVNNEVSLSWTSIQDTLRALVFIKDNSGDYYKVKYNSNGIIDFVTEVSSSMTRLDNFKYTKELDIVNNNV